ncbi:hypothetical protein [Edaphosphingomonas haloaromaticamans]|uniref:Catalase n=1 Tax=Edaphosphingomonas haloaromaticamans TaxID=653954 RepID=A0A1S1HJ50_9SPHN|nr:hypothetical protein [Sphingomonas haloaromaticamans]OHT22304.1 Catalase [Sphingomonas haloaromaticamans]
MNRDAAPWREDFRGGSREAEDRLFRAMAQAISPRPAARPDAAPVGTDRADRRLFHAKTAVGITDAALMVDRALPAGLVVGHFRPGAILPAAIRFSNASAIPQADGVPDMRGLAMRLAIPAGGPHDFVLANFPTALARNAEQFLALAMAAAGDWETRLARLASRIGLWESRRILAHLKASLKLCPSLAHEHFWSASPYLWGSRPVRFELRPVAGEPPPPILPAPGDNALRIEFASRIARRSVTYRLALQHYCDERRTPIEDAAVDWRPRAARPIEIATLVIPRQDISGREGRWALEQIDRLRFNPWNAPEDFRPLGSLNRLRRFFYAAGDQ